MKKSIFIAVSICLFVTSCKYFNADTSNKNEDKETLSKVRVRHEWFPNANFCGELIGSNLYDSINGLDITVEAGSDIIDPIKLVLSGESEIGIVGADKVVIANEKGADLAIIGILNYNSPTVFLTLNQNIKTPLDFKGKKVGVLSGTATEYVYKALLLSQNIKENEFKTVEVPFDLTTFANGMYDVRPAFSYDEPVSLDLKGLKYNVIKPEEYGVEFIGTVYFTTKKYLNENPEKVAKFLSTMKQGWKKAIEDPKLAVDFLKKYDKTIDEQREILSLNKAIPYFSKNGDVNFTCDTTHINRMGRSLFSIGVTKTQDININFDFSQNK